MQINIFCVVEPVGGCWIQVQATVLKVVRGKCTRAQSAIRPETNPDLPFSESWELSQDG